MKRLTHTIAKAHAYTFNEHSYIDYTVYVDTIAGRPETAPFDVIEVFEGAVFLAFQGLILLARGGFHALTGTDPTELSEEDRYHALVGCDWLVEQGHEQEANCLRWCVTQAERLEEENLKWKDIDDLSSVGKLPKAAARHRLDGG